MLKHGWSTCVTDSSGKIAVIRVNLTDDLATALLPFVLYAGKGRSPRTRLIKSTVLGIFSQPGKFKLEIIITND